MLEVYVQSSLYIVVYEAIQYEYRSSAFQTWIT